MTIAAIFFSIAILGIVGLYVAKPLLRPRFRRQRRMSQLDRLKIQKEATLIQIGDLDFDYQTGKLTEDDHQQQRSELMTEAASILQQMDYLQGQSTLSKPSSVDAEVETAIARTAAQIRTAEATNKGADIKGESQRGDPSQKLETERFICAKCGHAADFGDKFCSICGNTLKRPQHA